MSFIADNIARIREDIDAACRRSGRDAAEVRLIAVSKTKPASMIREAASAGITDIGENYVQEAEAKFTELDGVQVCRHMIGHLQRNKARRALELFDWIQTVDSLKLAGHLGVMAAERGRPVDILAEVNIGEEKEKSGFLPRDLEEAIRAMADMKGLSLRGLMIIPPEGTPEESRRFFRCLRRLCREITGNTGIDLPELSMGMSHDYITAVEEGATMIRVGRAIFGERR